VGEAPNQSKSALTETLQLDTADPSALTVRVGPRSGCFRASPSVARSALFVPGTGV